MNLLAILSFLLPVLSAAQPLDSEKRWALAMCASLAARWGGDPQLLGMIEDTPANRQQVRTVLTRDWGVDSRPALDSAIDNLLAGGHNAAFLRLARCADCEAGYDAAQLAIVRKYAPGFGKIGIEGWDLVRAAGLAQWGFRAGYYTEAEAWARLLPIARRTRATFHSWEHLQWNYLVGRRFWSPRDETNNSRLFYFYANFLWDPKSPWRNIPWKLDGRIDTPPATLFIFIRPGGVTCFDLWLLDKPAEPTFVPQLEALAGCKLKILEEGQRGRDFRLSADCHKAILPAPLASEFRMPLAKLRERLRNFGYSHLLVQIRQIPQGALAVKPDPEHSYALQGEFHAWLRLELKEEPPVLAIVHKH